MNNQQLENIIVKNFNIDEKKLRLGIASYIKEMGINIKKPSNNPLIFYQLREDTGIKDTYLESLSYILNSQTFNIYKHLLEFDLDRDWDNSNMFKFSANKVAICNYTSRTINRHLAVLNDLGLINKTRSNNGHNIGINYDFILDNLLINNLYNDKKFFDKLTIPTLEAYAEAKYDLNEFIQKKTKLIHKSILETMTIDFTEEQINKVLGKLYQIELNYKSKKISFISVGNDIYVYYNLKDHVTNRDLQILNYLVLKGVVGCLNINNINRYRIIDKSILNMDTIQTLEKETEGVVEEKVEATNNIADEVDTGSLTSKQSAAIIKSLDKFLDNNDLDVSDNKYKSFLRYGYYLKSRGVSEFTFVAYLKEMVSQNFDEGKLNYVITDMINKNFTNIFNYLEKNNMSTKTNKLDEKGNIESNKSTNANPLSKLTREEFMKLQEGRKDGKLYEEINEYKAQGKTEADYIKDKIGVDITKR